MNERNLRVLEFYKILDMLAALCSTEPGQTEARALKPSGDAATVELWQAQTEEASSVFAYCGGNPMAHFVDVRPFLKLAKAGGTLSPKALLQVADALKAARIVRVPGWPRTAASRRRSSTPSSPRRRSATTPAPTWPTSAARCGF